MAMLLPALRLQGERPRQPAFDGDPDCVAQAEFRAPHAFLSDQGAQEYRRRKFLTFLEMKTVAGVAGADARPA
jgi:hypothetical protein